MEYEVWKMDGVWRRENGGWRMTVESGEWGVMKKYDISR
jgi:hypothetical protein